MIVIWVGCLLSVLGWVDISAVSEAVVGCGGICGFGFLGLYGIVLGWKFGFRDGMVDELFV